jgi:hypothetical protein
MGENFCQPPLLPLSRAIVELPEFPERAAEPAFELPRVPVLLSVLRSEFWLDR